MSLVYFIMIFIFFDKDKMFCYGIRNKAKLQEMQNNIEVFLKPIKKLSGIFPNHEIEVQFDIEETKHEPKVGSSLKTELRTNINPGIDKYKLPEHKIIRSSDDSTSSSVTTGSTTTESALSTDSVKQVVYMEDLKKALDDFANKHNLHKDCNHQTTPKIILPEINPNLQLQDIFNLLKNNVHLQKGEEKPNDEEVSWIKIQVPA